MNSMHIYQDPADGNWYCGLSDTYKEVLRYRFAGDVETQESSIKAMGTLMSEGRTDDWDVLFEATEEPDMASILLTTTDSIWFADNPAAAWTVAGQGASAWEEIEVAGEDLLQALVF